LGTSGTVKFNGTTATTTAWINTSITATVPTGATTGPVTVTVGTATSNGLIFVVGSGPGITGLSPVMGPTGTVVTITGVNFGTTPGTVTFNGMNAPNPTWSATSITVAVPSGATTGNVVVTAGGVASTGFGATQGSNTASFDLNGVLTPLTVVTGGWSDTAITVQVPAGTATGVVNVVVTVGGQVSNEPQFTVASPFSCN
jgi:hypothetical protein